MICTSYRASRTVNFGNLVPSKKIIYCRGISPNFVSQFRNVIFDPLKKIFGMYWWGFKMADQAKYRAAKTQLPNPDFFYFDSGGWVGQVTWTRHFCECGLRLKWSIWFLGSEGPCMARLTSVINESDSMVLVTLIEKHLW